MLPIVILVGIFFVVACGAPSELILQARVPCIGPIYSNVPLDPARVSAAIQEALKRLEDYGIMSRGAACEFFSGIPIYYWGDKRIIPDRDNQDGSTDLSGIRLAWGGRSLIHEMLHEIDVRRDGNLLSAAHWGWAKKNFYVVAAEDYMAKLKSWS